jgi:hypothetical protein
VTVTAQASLPKDAGADTVVVGVIADPVTELTRIARQLAQDLPRLLAEQLQEDCTWQVDVRREQLPASDVERTDMMEVGTRRKRQYGWDLVVCVTDLPLRQGKQPVVADVSNSRSAIVLSMPAFGAMPLRRRVGGVVTQLIADLRGGGTAAEHTEAHRRRRLPALASQFRRVTPGQDGVDIRVVASRGGMRLLIGMVRANRPWQLVFGLRGPLAGAFAFSAFYLISTSVWQLATTMGPLRLLASALGSVAVMVSWLVIYHHLWERTAGLRTGEREHALLFNSTTVLTLAIGVGFMYLALYAVNLAAASVVLVPEVFGQYVGSDPGIWDYARVMVLVTAAGTVAGAVGSGFESEDAVREAAYSFRDRERREALRELQRRREEEELSGEAAESEDT